MKIDAMVRKMIKENSRSFYSTCIEDLMNEAPRDSPKEENPFSKILEGRQYWDKSLDGQKAFGTLHAALDTEEKITLHSPPVKKGTWPFTQGNAIEIYDKLLTVKTAVVEDVVSDSPSSLCSEICHPVSPPLDHAEIDTYCEKEPLNKELTEEMVILPCPSVSSFSKNNQKNRIERKGRLQVLKSLDQMACGGQYDGAEPPVIKKSASIQRGFLDEAGKMISNTLDDPIEDEDSKTALSIMDDTWDKESAQLNEEKDLERNSDNIKETKEDTQRENRLSFLFFALGFIFPPLWIIGAIYLSCSNAPRSSESKAIDARWRRYSKNAFFFLLSTVLAICMLILILKPELLGFRVSNVQAHSEE